MKNTLLAQTDAAITKSVKPADRNAFERISLAGMKVMFDKKMHQTLMQGLSESPDKINTVAEGIVGILSLLYKESRNTMTVTPMITAGMALLLQALAFMEDAGMLQVDAAALEQATQHYVETLLPKLGITPEKMAAIMAKGQEATNDPQAMAKFKQLLGG
jgi:hypothetical protein